MIMVFVFPGDHMVLAGICDYFLPLLVAQTIKNSHAMQETQVQLLGQEGPLEKGLTSHSSILAWRTPWTVEFHGPQSLGSWRVGHDWVTNTFTLSSTTYFIFPLSLTNLTGRGSGWPEPSILKALGDHQSWYYSFPRTPIQGWGD